MKKTHAILVCVLSVWTLFSNYAIAQKTSSKLYIYNWTDTMSPELIADFEKKTGVKVVIDSFDSNDTLLAKLKSGARGYDIIMPSGNFVPIFIKEKLLQKIDYKKKLKNYKNLVQKYKSLPWDKKSQYTVPFITGTTSFAINTKYISKTVNSYATLFNPPKIANGKVGMFSEAEENIMIYFMYKGYPLCTQNPKHYKEAVKAFRKQKRDVKTYNSDTIENTLSNEDVYIHAAWNGSILRGRKTVSSLQYVYPKEGVSAWVDTMAIPVGAKNVDLALQFMDFYYTAKHTAQQINYVGYDVPVKGVKKYLSGDIANAPEIRAPKGTKVVFQQSCPVKVKKLQNKAWKKIKR